MRQSRIRARSGGRRIRSKTMQKKLQRLEEATYALTSADVRDIVEEGHSFREEFVRFRTGPYECDVN